MHPIGPPRACTEPTSEHPLDPADVSAEGSEGFPWFGEPEFDEECWEPDLSPEYEPSDLMPDLVQEVSEKPSVDPMSQTAWKRFAQTELQMCELRNIKQARVMSLSESFSTESFSNSLSSMLAMPSNSLKLLTQHPEADPDARDSVDAIQRLTYVRRVRIARSDDDLRDASLTKLKSILLLDPTTTRLGELLVPVSSRPLSDNDIRKSLEQAFSKNSSNTLYKRACALTRYVEWFLLLNHQGSPLRLKEFDIYSYLGHLESGKAGATAASSFLEALRFLDSVAVLTCADLGVVLSPRVTGFAHQQFLRKAPLKQKDPMPCLVVAELEKLLLRQEDNVQTCILGQLLWCFHAASWWSDAMRLQCLKLEKIKDVALVTGEALGSKTSVTKEAQTRLLPYAAIGTGVSGLLWAEKWLDARVEELGREPEPFLPSFSCRTGRWSSTPMSSSEAGGYLQDFVEEIRPLMDPFPKLNVQNLGTHSLKTGLLTMAARSTAVKFSMSERRTLGHHIKPGDRSVLTYSREAYTSLYAKVLACFREIQLGNFRPDSSALERIIEAADTLTSGFPVPADIPPLEAEMAETTDLWEISSESSEEEQGLIGVLESQEETVGRKPFPGEQEVSCIVHRKSGIVHGLTSSGATTLCGRHVSANYVALERAAIDDMECCILCGRQLSNIAA